MKKIVRITATCSLLIVAACDSNLFGRSAALEATVENQKTRIEALEKRVTDLDTKV
jgi:hypothetical protein